MPRLMNTEVDLPKTEMKAQVQLTLPPVLREHEDFQFPLVVNMSVHLKEFLDICNIQFKDMVVLELKLYLLNGRLDGILIFQGENYKLTCS